MRVDVVEHESTLSFIDFLCIAEVQNIHSAPKTPQDSDGWVEEHNSLTGRDIPRVDPAKICGFSRSRFHGLRKHAISGKTGALWHITGVDPEMQ